MPSLYNVGDTITIRLGAMEGEEIVITGVVVEVRLGNPPRASALLPEDPYCYKLQGGPQYYRESSVTHPLSMAA